jgi:putative intracellular protease/amidase
MSVNCFTDAEEKKVGKDRAVPFLLETRLQEQGARIRKSPPFKSCLATDGQLITGQNPASASGVAQAILAKLGVTAGHRAA